MLIFCYKALSALLFVVILNCETASLFRGGVVGASSQKPKTFIYNNYFFLTMTVSINGRDLTEIKLEEMEKKADRNFFIGIILGVSASVIGNYIYSEIKDMSCNGIYISICFIFIAICCFFIYKKK